MPWKISPSHYDPLDLNTLHDDELIAIERALSDGAITVANEYDAAWRALQKIRPLAQRCNGDGDPTHLLPPGAARRLPERG